MLDAPPPPPSSSSLRRLFNPHPDQTRITNQRKGRVISVIHAHQLTNISPPASAIAPGASRSRARACRGTAPRRHSRWSEASDAQAAPCSAHGRTSSPSEGRLPPPGPTAVSSAGQQQPRPQRQRHPYPAVECTGGIQWGLPHDCRFHNTSTQSEQLHVCCGQAS
jgi:hypothetical protein